MSRTVLITGASSGVGRALALRLAEQGNSLALLGRNHQRLDQIAAECRTFGVDVSTASIDVRCREEMSKWIVSFDQAKPVDLVIANAAILEGTGPDQVIEGADASYALMECNVLGVLNTVQPLLPAMISRRHGQIALVSSIAAFTPLPDAPSYAASKAAVLSYGLSLRDCLAAVGIGVSVICLGYTDTPMLRRQSGLKPFRLTPERAAARICFGLARNRAIIIEPILFGWFTRLGGVLPERVRRWAGRSFRFKIADQYEHE